METLYWKAKNKSTRAMKAIYSEFKDRVFLVSKLLVGADGAAETVCIRTWDRAWERLMQEKVDGEDAFADALSELNLAACMEKLPKKQFEIRLREKKMTGRTGSDSNADADSNADPNTAAVPYENIDAPFSGNAAEALERVSEILQKMNAPERFILVARLTDLPDEVVRKVLSIDAETAEALALSAAESYEAFSKPEKFKGKEREKKSNVPAFSEIRDVLLKSIGGKKISEKTEKICNDRIRLLSNADRKRTAGIIGLAAGLALVLVGAVVTGRILKGNAEESTSETEESTVQKTYSMIYDEIPVEESTESENPSESGTGAPSEETKEPSETSEETKDPSESSTENYQTDYFYAYIEIENYGTIQLILDPVAAPETVQNFVDLARSGFYDGLTFHRVINGFGIVSGDPTGTGSGGSGKKITGEFEANGITNYLNHLRGVVSMARGEDYDSATSQFFILQTDSTYLDGNYAAFGYVMDGLDIIDLICENTRTIDGNGMVEQDQQPKILSITIQGRAESE